MTSVDNSNTILAPGSLPMYTYEEGFTEKDDSNELNFKPRILIMGLRRSGKTSIKNVVFHKMEPTDTLFLESTTKTHSQDVSCCSFITFQVYDCAGQVNMFQDPTCDYQVLLKGCGSLIFVIDAQDEDQYHEAIQCLISTVRQGYEINPAIKFEVFVHKVDGFPDERKVEIMHDLQQQTNEFISSQDGHDSMLQNVSLYYHCTSIYDHSIFDAFSKVVQKLIPHHKDLEKLLNVLCNSCGLERAYLFDVSSKIYIASDSLSPLDPQLYELCCDKIDLVLDISNIYSPKDIEGISHDDQSYTCVKLYNDYYIYLKQVNKFLAFVCVIRDEVFSENRGVMDYNLTLFKDSVEKIISSPSQQQQLQQQHQQFHPNQQQQQQMNNYNSSNLISKTNGYDI
jgi:Ras-related GTP-binding protein C/D